MVPVLVVLAVFVALELWSVPRRVAPEYKLVGCIELLAVLAREQAVALVELVASEVLALRAALVAAVGDAGRLATGKSAEVAVLKFVVVQVQAQVCFRSVVVEHRPGCIELPAVLKPQLAEVLVVVPVESVPEARLVVQAAVPLVV